MTDGPETVRAKVEALAKVIAADGWSKDDVRAYLCDHVTIPARQAERYAWHLGSTAFTLEGHVRDGVLPSGYAASADPERAVPVFVRPEWIGQGGRVSRKLAARPA
jgi:hypothetical protein